MMRVAGIDGCKSGWVAVAVEDGDASSAAPVHGASLAVLLDLTQADLAVVDVPIGLTDGPADRDVEAAMRAVLAGKASSVFNTPCRAALAEASYAGANAVNRAVLGKGLSKQTFAIMPKIAEADIVARARGQDRLREGHPEVSFSKLAGAPVRDGKTTLSGQAIRRRLLEDAGFPVGRLVESVPRGFRGGLDDLLDACILAWSALRLSKGKHLTLPPLPSRDGQGLVMSVVA